MDRQEADKFFGDRIVTIVREENKRFAWQVVKFVLLTSAIVAAMLTVRPL